MDDEWRSTPQRDLEARHIVRLSQPHHPRRSLKSRVLRLVLVLVICGFVLAAVGPFGLVLIAVIAGLTAPAWTGWWRSRR